MVLSAESRTDLSYTSMDVENAAQIADNVLSEPRITEVFADFRGLHSQVSQVACITRDASATGDGLAKR
jgi:hypothetical protein